MSQFDPKASPYPSARRDEHYDTYKSKANGEVKVHDPYRWLEVPPSESSETKAFVEAQAQYTSDYLQKDVNRGQLKEALTENWNYARFSCPSLKNDGYYYYNFNSGLQPQSTIYRIHSSKLPASVDNGADGLKGELFFDPNRLSKDGTASLGVSAFSESGKYYAYGVSRSGSDWTTIYVRKTDTPHSPDLTEVPEGGQDDGRMEDVLRHVKFSGISWTRDDRGFFYQRLPVTADHGKDTDDKAGTETGGDKDAEIFYHRLGEPQSKDTLFVARDPEHPEYMYGTEVTDDGKYLVMSTSKDTAPSCKLWILDLSKTGTDKLPNDGQWQKLVDRFGASYEYIANDGSVFYFMTNDGASKYKVVKIDLLQQDQGFVDHVPEDPNAILTSAWVVDQDKLILIRSRDVKDEMHIHDLKSGEPKGRIGANLIGDFAQVTGRRHHTEMFFTLTGFSNPGLVYRYDFKKGDGEKLFRSTVVKGLKPEEFSTEQIFYESKDGTKVPMFIVTPQGVPQDGSSPVLLYGYGGFSISMGPFFSPEMLTFCKSYGARLAVANIRGGAEYGEDWHEAAIKQHRQRAFDDFQWAAKRLISDKYASEKGVIIYGGSNGGALVCACANQAPELFGCVLSAVGVLDLLRFQNFTIGRAWVSDYGTSADPEGFDYLYKWSPLHNVRANKTYPPMLLLTGDHDDRVSPLHSFKHIATLQHTLPTNPSPLMMRVALKAGHGAGKSTQQRIEEATDRWSFVALSMGLHYRTARKAGAL